MKALCLGAADCLWDDVAASGDILGDDWWDIVVACNRAGVDWPGHLDHWVSLHPEKLLALWVPEREGNDDYVTWSDPNRGERGPAPTDRHLDNWGGSSGLFAVQVAAEVGADRVVACGMPLDRSPHYHGRAEWDAADAFRPAWERRIDEMADVRSMSGWTAELVGRPDADWIRELPEPVE